MAMLWLAERIRLENAIFQSSMREWHTPRHLLAMFTPCFSEVTGVPWPVAIISLDNATFHPCTRECHTSRFVQAIFIQSFSGTTAALWLSERIVIDNAIFHHWKRGWNTSRCSQAMNILYCSRVTAMLLLAVGMIMDNAWQCAIPPLEPGICYLGRQKPIGPDLVLQVNFVCADDIDDAVALICSTLAGEEKLTLTAHGPDPVWDLHKRIARELNVDLQSLRVVLFDGQLLAKMDVGQNGRPRGPQMLV